MNPYIEEPTVRMPSGRIVLQASVGLLDSLLRDGRTVRPDDEDGVIVTPTTGLHPDTVFNIHALAADLRVLVTESHGTVH